MIEMEPFENWVPTVVTAAIVAPLMVFFNGLSVASQAFAVFMAIDFVMGAWAAYMRKEFKKNKLTIMFLTKLIVYFGILAVAHYIALISGAQVLNTVAIGVILSKEGLSILGHAVELKVFNKAELGFLQKWLETLGKSEEDNGE
jgi:phage-related holin